MMRHIAIAQASDADVLIKKGECVYGGAVIFAAATADTLLKVYDAASVATVADSKLVDIIGHDASLEGNNSTKTGIGGESTKCTLGLVAVITGTNGLAVVKFK